jgi:hypothetical protein
MRFGIGRKKLVGEVFPVPAAEVMKVWRRTKRILESHYYPGRC